MNIKSDYLIHWTGKDICNPTNVLCDTGRQQYIDRLGNTCTTGLWMMPNSEHLTGCGNWQFNTFSHITCFTENRLNYYRKHANTYGLMGLGFSRQWVIDRDGLPAFYLKNDSTDIQTQIISNLLIKLPTFKDINGNIDLQPYKEFSLLMDYIKPMSRINAKDFFYLEEAEWRIAWNNSNQAGKNFVVNPGKKPPEYYLPFTPNDLKLVILPDNKTRKLSSMSPPFQSFLQKSNGETLVVSLEELENL